MVNDDAVGGTDFRSVSNCDIISSHKPNWTSATSASTMFNYYLTEYTGTPAKPIYFSEPVPEWAGESTMIDAAMRMAWGTTLAKAGFVLQNDASLGF